MGPTIAPEHGFPTALESGIAVVALGLIIASLLGGHIAKLLIERNALPTLGTAEEGASMLAVNVAVILGYLVHAWLTSAGANSPLFVPCLLMGILLSNTVPVLFPRISWPAHTAALSLISNYALSIFLAM